MGSTDWIPLVAVLGVGAYVLTQTDILQQLTGGGAQQAPPPEEQPPAEEPQQPQEGEGGMGPGGITTEFGDDFGDEEFDPGFMDPNARQYRDLCLQRRGCVWLSVPGSGNSYCSCNPNEHRRIRKPMAQAACFRLGGFWNGRYCTYYVPYPYVYPRPVIPPIRGPIPRGCPLPANHFRYPGDGCPPGTTNRFNCCRPRLGARPYPPAEPRPRILPVPNPLIGPPRGGGRVCTPYRRGNPEWIAGKGGRCCEQRRILGSFQRACWEYGRSISLGDAYRTPRSVARPGSCVNCPPPPHPNVVGEPGPDNDPGREDRGQRATSPRYAQPGDAPGSAWGWYA